jgi:hypothetical protein
MPLIQRKIIGREKKNEFPSSKLQNGSENGYCIITKKKIAQFLIFYTDNFYIKY